MTKLKLNVIRARKLFESRDKPLSNEAGLRAIARIGKIYSFTTKIHTSTSNACNFYEFGFIEFNTSNNLEDQIIELEIGIVSFPTKTLGCLSIQLSKVEENLVDGWFDLVNNSSEKVGEVLLKMELIE